MIKTLLTATLLLTASNAIAEDYWQRNSYLGHNYNYHLKGNNDGGSHTYRNIVLGRGNGYVSVYSSGEGAGRDVGYKTTTSNGHYPVRYKTIYVNPNPPLPSGNYNRGGNRR